VEVSPLSSAATLTKTAFVAAESERVELVLADALRIRVPPRFDLAALVQMVSALEAR
jgi:hypothetical protein